MKKSLLAATLSLFLTAALPASNGDTTTIRTHNASHWNWYGSIDTWTVFPDTSFDYRKITLKYKLGCPSIGCSDWDYTTQIFVLRHTGTYDSTASQLPYFSVNSTSPDSLNYSTVATYQHFFDTTNMVTDSALTAQYMIVLYEDSLDPSVPTDTIYGWPAEFWNYNYDSTGAVTDSAWVVFDTTIYNAWYTVYTVFEVIEPIELARYITPYGNNLNAAWNNTWEFDITDYAPLLHDSVEIRAFYSGWSDGFTVTLDFEMIEGTPPRTPKRVTTLWTGYFPYGNTSNSIENYLVPVTQVLYPGEVASAVRVNITGHGFGGNENCAEFCPKMYYLKFNNTQYYSKLAWRDNCGMNAHYPQPGTWLYDRANWCPGDKVWPSDFSLTPYAQPGDTVVIDMDMQPWVNINNNGPGYQVDGQLITYGAPNFTLDAELLSIVAPNSNKNVQRMNPVCDKPIIIIRNTGSTALTSLDIAYGVTGAPAGAYTWTGNLAFLETDTVFLPTVNWYGTAAEFYATVSNPNNQADQYADNNSLKVAYVAAPEYNSYLVFECRTNNFGYETNYQLTDANGNVILSRNNLTANTIYRDTFNLVTGCYIFRMYDSGKDGLSWWANSSGTGYCRIKKAATGQIQKGFNADFGTELYQEFTVGYNIGMEETPAQTELTVYPNPTDGSITIDVQSADEQVEVIVFDYTGRVVSTQKVNTENTSRTLQVDLSGEAAGLYFVQLRSSEGVRTVRVVKN